MNNKGQTLVLFVVLLPIILTLFIFLIDMGFLYIDRRNMENVANNSIEYYKQNKDINDYISKNIEDIDDIKIENNNGVISITLIKTKKGIFKDYTIKVTKEG